MFLDRLPQCDVVHGMVQLVLSTERFSLPWATDILCTSTLLTPNQVQILGPVGLRDPKDFIVKMWEASQGQQP